jgi:hypothetical protein
MRILTNFFEKRAASSYAAKDIAHEFGFLIALVSIAKVLASFFNGYAAFAMVKNYAADEFNNETVGTIAAICVLVLLEFTLNLCLFLFFKANFRGHIKRSVSLLFLVFCLFGMSFTLTTNGLAQIHAKKADNTQVILDKFNLETASLKATAENDRNQLLDAIETTKKNPQGWLNGERKILTAWQLKDIKGNYDKIAEINNTLRSDIEKVESGKSNDLKSNSGNVLNAERKYYKYGIAAMILQVFLNGIIVFFYSRIYKEKYKPELARENMKDIANNVYDMNDKLIMSSMSNLSNNYAIAFSTIMTELNKIKTDDIKKDSDKKIGFKKDNDNNFIENRNTKIVNDTNNIKNSFDENSRICKHCNKPFIIKHHKQLYCTDKCRMDHWEINNNRRLKWNK